METDFVVTSDPIKKKYTSTPPWCGAVRCAVRCGAVIIYLSSVFYNFFVATTSKSPTKSLFGADTAI